MNKFAQERGWLDRKIEEYHPGKILDKQPPAYVEKLDELRKVDDEIRQIAVGEGDSKSLKDLLKLSKQKLSEREYILSFRYLAEFHERAYEISKKLNDLSLDFDKAYDEIMVPEDFESEKEYLENISKRFKTSQLNENSIIVTAGIIDWIKDNFGSDRRKTLAYWEKINPKQSKIIKSETSSLVSQSQSLLTKLLSSLKEMSSLRNKRKVYQYGDVAKKFLKDFNIYHSNFQKYHDNHIVPFLKKYKSFTESNLSNEVKDLKQDNPPLPQEIGTTNNDERIKEIIEIKTDIEKQKISLENDLAQSIKEIKKMQENQTALQNKINDLISQKERTDSETEELKNKLKELEESKRELSEANKRYHEIIEENKRLSQEIQSLKEQITPKDPERHVALAPPTPPVVVEEAPPPPPPPPPSPPVVVEEAPPPPRAAPAPPASPASSGIARRPSGKRKPNLDSEIKQALDSEIKEDMDINDNDLERIKELTKQNYHNNFIEMLESLSSESPLILKSIILKEAKQLYNTDKNKALKLIDVAKRIK